MSPHDIEQRVIGAAWAYAIFAAATIAMFTAVLACHGISALVRRRRARRDDLGPDRLWEEVDAHLAEVIAADPQLAAGLDRLRTAVRNEQHKGDQ
ncbi:MULTISPECIES: hypothetical protein [unclassified Streptomyces]|uniref:hypothetical protein n=1 Tax=unclassified Streptomyces TaxID=2593676 RepID=UPI0004C4DD1A|nr:MULTISPECIES: hypothetical protein [unclassified Streptomyces]KOV86102.1 hypothetical protein ADL02_19645 [Streptomyces sp. NRRL WC-3723]